MTHDVFISHSSKDKAFADAVCAALEANGIRCWMAPRDIRPSESWAAAILRGISHGRMMVLVFSANANSSPHVRREVERAVAHAMPILPVRIEDVLPADELEYFLSSSHWLDALTPPFQEHLRELAVTVRAVLGSRAASPTTAPEPGSPAPFQEVSFAPVETDNVGAPTGERPTGGIPAHGGGKAAELEYEKCVMMTLRSGGSLESIRKELDDCRTSIGLPIRLAREIEAACLDSFRRKPIHGRAPAAPAGPAGPDPLTRFFKSASESIASIFSNPRPVQPGTPTNRQTPAPPMHPAAKRASGGGPPPVPWLVPPPPVASGVTPVANKPADEAESVKEALKEEFRAGLTADLAEAVVKKDVIVGADGKPAEPVKAEGEAAPAPRKPPPLPPLPPPLHWPQKGKPGK